MAQFTRSIEIKAPVQQVFDYWKDPTHWPEVWPSMIEVKEAKGKTGLGTKFAWVYKMAGMKFEGEGTFTKIEPNKRIEETTRGGIDSHFVWTFAQVDGGTRMEAKVEYEIPIPIIGKMVEKAVLAMNEHEAEATLANLKSKLEHAAA